MPSRKEREKERERIENSIDFKFGGRKKEVWKTIKEALEKASLKTAESLRDTLQILAEVAGSLKKADQFQHLPTLFRQVEAIDPKLYEKFFTQILPKIQEWARQFPTHFPEMIGILRAGKNGKVQLTEKQCVYMLSAAFFCILPEPTTDAIQSLNFRKFFRADEPKQAHKLCAVLRYFEYHVTQLKPPFERDPEEEVEAFKERQKEFRQQVYAKWAARTITLVRGKHEVPQRTRRRSRGSSFAEPNNIGVDMSYWSATEIPLDKCELKLSPSEPPQDADGNSLPMPDILRPRTENQLVRCMELQTSRYGGDFLGQSFDAVDTFFASHVEALCFMPFVEKADLSKEWLAVRSVRKSCEMTPDFAVVVRPEGYPDGRDAPEDAFAVPDGLQEFPIEAVSCSFSTKKTTPETLDAIKQALQPRSYVPEEVPEDDDSVDEGPTADGTNNENDGGQTSGSAGGAGAGGTSSKKPEAETFFKEKKDRIIVLPFNFITHFAGDDLEQQIIWILLWWLVCCEQGVSELRIAGGMCSVDMAASVRGPSVTNPRGIENQQSVREALGGVVEALREKNIRGGLLYSLLYEYQHSVAVKKCRNPVSGWLQSTLLFGN
mmetsp:Transcript_13619/g.33508  ORF Transcript_13619/g.33508 Transcript_13619/m.33508 type:complete len:605 (-) Transcript_13619:117-1931(-)|eukprot:CAMPEP_0178991600 /NCGR_PEP_ID=MMETSP0795-20121207/5624_1 /TAXON_ID=88552 /ORGANISM="Amoebophrya sp., Strain Ameob2" /LENGTH=604 /DNA_ID=CAMNT_0020683339 /DNA_START=420 /DNA_END=2234 /DNA_ORIENTATION=+